MGWERGLNQGPPACHLPTLLLSHHLHPATVPGFLWLRHSCSPCPENLAEKVLLLFPTHLVKQLHREEVGSRGVLPGSSPQQGKGSPSQQPKGKWREEDAKRDGVCRVESCTGAWGWWCWCMYPLNTPGGGVGGRVCAAEPLGLPLPVLSALHSLSLSPLTYCSDEEYSDNFCHLVSPPAIPNKLIVPLLPLHLHEQLCQLFL